jgi:hypothetical protein
MGGLSSINWWKEEIHCIIITKVKMTPDEFSEYLLASVIVDLSQKKRYNTID